MVHGAYAFLLSLCLVVSASPCLAESFAGTWGFKLVVQKTSCADTKKGDARNLDLLLEQSGRVISGNVQVVGSGQFFYGYTNTNGFVASLKSSCAVVPGVFCSPNVETFSYERNLATRQKSGKIVWVTLERNDQNQFSCSTVYTGKATKKK